MAKQRRQYQIAEKIRQIIANELLMMGDPRFAFVTITSVAVTPDLRLAKVYWVISGKERQEEVAEAFLEASSLLRRVLNQKLEIRYSPELKFYYDNTLDTSEEVERLLSKARAR